MVSCWLRFIQPATDKRSKVNGFIAKSFRAGSQTASTTVGRAPDSTMPAAAAGGAGEGHNLCEMFAEKGTISTRVRVFGQYGNTPK